jgi:hypothetical protein
MGFVSGNGWLGRRHVGMQRAGGAISSANQYPNAGAISSANQYPNAGANTTANGGFFVFVWWC